MSVLGIVAEYDPIHNGHIYHLAQSREISRADFIVCVMSGDFTQRGEAALLDKWTRSRLAVEAGADLVLELPFVYASQSAEYFAFGAMEIFRRLGMVTHVSFGVEDDRLELLRRIAACTLEEGETYRSALRKGLEEGRSFAEARGAAIGVCLGEEAAEAAASPNNLLAIEYLKYMGEMEPLPILRSVAHHGEEASPEGHLSGSEIRRRILAGEEPRSLPIPESCKEAIREAAGHLGGGELLFPLIRQHLLLAKPEEMARCFDMEEGLEHRILEHRRQGESYREFLDLLKTRRYPETRLKRALLHLLLGLPKMDIKAPACTEGLYGRVLAAGEGGRRLLRELDAFEGRSLPLLTKIRRDMEPASLAEILSWDIRAADLYNQATGRPLYEESDYVKKPYMAL